MNSTGRRLLTAIAVLAAAGVVVSSVSLYHHYQKSETSFCNISESLNCDIVNRSIYSEVMGVPVALIGMVGYASLFVAAVFRRARPETPKVLLAASLAGLGFALYLTYIEGFVLGAWCVLCLSSLVVIFAVAVVSAILAVRERKESQRASPRDDRVAG